jgi:murein DD-endopeptidase MepM/ murein hydrolase activator NlpD
MKDIKPLAWPIKGVGIVPGITITQKFNNSDISLKYGGNGKHNGIDIGASINTPIVAAHDGKAKFLVQKDSGEYKGFGIHVKCYTDNYHTVYGHMIRFPSGINEGDEIEVKQGQIIGYVGNTGYSTGPHLHFGYRLNNANQQDGYFGYSNPMDLLKIRAFFHGYRKHPEKGVEFRMDSMERLAWFFQQSPALADIYEIEQHEIRLPLDTPPYPST